MFIDKLNLNHLRIFESVYRSRSMTRASRDLHLTQSGVSQHIKTLEDALGVQLFDRIKQRLIPTGIAVQLFEESSQGLGRIEEALVRIKGQGQTLSGAVSIGMPIEFGNNLIMPLLAKFGRLHPMVQFRVRLDYASAFNDLLLSGQMDFAVVDEYALDRRIHTEVVYNEILELCASRELIAQKGVIRNTRQYFENLEYVEYQEKEPILRMWFQHHLGVRNLKLNVRATVMDVQGLGRLILNGLGVGVLPHYRVKRLASQGEHLHVFKGSGKPLVNRMSLAYLRERSHSPAVLALLKHFREVLPNFGKQSSNSKGGTDPCPPC